jgi:hypothetical protein
MFEFLVKQMGYDEGAAQRRWDVGRSIGFIGWPIGSSHCIFSFGRCCGDFHCSWFLRVGLHRCWSLRFGLHRCCYLRFGLHRRCYLRVGLHRRCYLRFGLHRRCGGKKNRRCITKSLSH